LYRVLKWLLVSFTDVTVTVAVPVDPFAVKVAE
jgi:hypothetical protein